MKSCAIPMWERPRCRDCGGRTTDLTSAQATRAFWSTARIAVLTGTSKGTNDNHNGHGNKKETGAEVVQSLQGLDGLGLAVRTPQKTAIPAVLQNVGSVIQNSGVLLALHHEFWFFRTRFAFRAQFENLFEQSPFIDAP